MRTLALTATGIAAIFLLLGLGYYRIWFLDKPLFYWNAFIQERSSPASYEQIRRARYGTAYVLSMAIRDTVVKRGMKDPVLLFEPNTYYRDSLHYQLSMPEPSVFYYYTGLRGVWTTSPGVEKANYLVRISAKGMVELEAIQSPAALQAILDRYRKFVPMLL